VATTSKPRQTGVISDREYGKRWQRITMGRSNATTGSPGTVLKPLDGGYNDVERAARRAAVLQQARLKLYPWPRVRIATHMQDVPDRQAWPSSRWTVDQDGWKQLARA
jgi:hypothetical protein